MTTISTTSTVVAVTPEMITCSCPCGRSKPAEQMRVPDWDSLKRLNGGRRVAIDELGKFALTGECAYKLKGATGVKCFPLLAARAAAEKSEAERLAAQQLRAEEARKAAEARKAQSDFFQKFVTPKNTGAGRKEVSGQPVQLPPRSADGRNVGGGLSRLSREDKRKGGYKAPRPESKQETPAQAAVTQAPKPTVSAPDGVQ